MGLSVCIPEAEVGAGAADDGARHGRDYEIGHHHVVFPYLYNISYYYPKPFLEEEE